VGIRRTLPPEWDLLAAVVPQVGRYSREVIAAALVALAEAQNDDTVEIEEWINALRELQGAREAGSLW
jgi:hypothetical protein